MNGHQHLIVSSYDIYNLSSCEKDIMETAIHSIMARKLNICWKPKKTFTMITWIITAAVLAVLFGILGFTGIARGFAAIAKVLFYIFVIVLIITIISSLL